MSRPSAKNSRVNIDGIERNLRVARFGRAPLIHLWLHEPGEGGIGMILDIEQADALVDGLADLLDEIEAEGWKPLD